MKKVSESVFKKLFRRMVARKGVPKLKPDTPFITSFLHKAFKKKSGIILLAIAPSLLDAQSIDHGFYRLQYNEEAEQADVVEYTLTKEMVYADHGRTNDFRNDPAVPAGSATLEDYKGSGFDRGHLCPSEDMDFSKESVSATFLMSNMSPQKPRFNREIWLQAENYARDQAVKRGKIRIATGPVLALGHERTIGGNKVWVPKAFYKAILDERKGEAVAIVLPHENSIQSPLDPKYAMSIDSLESQTGIDFFQDLPDGQEASIEAACDPAAWGLSGKPGFDDKNLLYIVVAAAIILLLVLKAAKMGRRIST